MQQLVSDAMHIMVAPCMTHSISNEACVMCTYVHFDACKQDEITTDFEVMC